VPHPGSLDDSYNITDSQFTSLFPSLSLQRPVGSTLGEAMEHRHNVARNTFIEVDGFKQPGPAPKFSRTESKTPMGVAHAGEHSKEGLADWGFAAAEIDRLASSGAIRQR
jgi:crotonobetainyl-CoA:carnitine CoA-transferase CaiB-like acyl-CoA transferase